MIVRCKQCQMYFEDCYRSTICPHDPFPANDGNNNFEVHNDAYLSPEPCMDPMVKGHGRYPAKKMGDAEP